MRHWFLFLAIGSLACSSTVKNSVSDAQDSDEGATSSSSDGTVVGTTGEAGVSPRTAAAASQDATAGTSSSGSGGSSAIQDDPTTNTTGSEAAGSGGAPDVTTSTTDDRDTVSTTGASTGTTGTSSAGCPSFCKAEPCDVTSTEENHGCAADSYTCGIHQGYVVDDGTELPCADTGHCSGAEEDLNEYWAACEERDKEPEPEPEDFGCEDLDIYLRCGGSAKWRIWSPGSTECATGQLRTTAVCYPEEFNGAITYDVPEGHCLVVHGANSQHHDEQCSPVGTTLPNPYGGIEGVRVVTLAFTGSAPEVHMYRDTLGLCPYVGGGSIVPDSQCGVHPGLDGPCGINADQAAAGCQSCPVDSSGAQIDPDAIGCQ